MDLWIFSYFSLPNLSSSKWCVVSPGFIKPLLECIVFRKTVMLGGEPSAHYEVLRSLNQVFQILTSLPVPRAYKHPHTAMPPPPCVAIGTESARRWFPARVTLGVEVKVRTNSKRFIVCIFPRSDAAEAGTFFPAQDHWSSFARVWAAQGVKKIPFLRSQ